ncbi:BA14K family protein [Allosphingosinicella indica]|uniref:Lectin-like protein BA14k n=1 Tax=Allosphingosinicella indica TaxID=941907 RepID=A0A1X7GD39_9SPHN|nr:BA14K family protein [Allosphingosinicella indica]SMF67865.1 BA14K-like protein [Allosphingosinicella indica]
MRIFLGLYAAILMASPALAQAGQAPMQDQTPPPVDRTMPAPEGTTPPPGPVADSGDRPDGFTGTDAEWADHVRSCQDRYQGYDPATNKYRAPNGDMKSCPHSAMKKR